MNLIVNDEFSPFTARSVLYPLLFVVTGLWLLHRWQQQSRIFRLGNKIPGPPTFPFFGNALMVFFKKPEDFGRIAFEHGDKYGQVVRAWMGSKLHIFIVAPEDIEVILNSHVHIDKSAEYRYFKPWLGEGLLISSGQKWYSHRKMIAPTFHINILKSFVGVFNQNSRSVVAKLRAEIGKTIDIHDHMSEVTVDILLETAMGITKTTQDKSGYDYAMAVMKMCDIIHQRHYKFWLRLDSIFQLHPLYKTQQKLLDIIHGLTTKVIRNKKQIYYENKAKGITPLTISELTQKKDTGEILANNTNTLSDAVFKGYRDDLDFNDENDVGEKKRYPFLDLMLESAQNKTNNISDHEIKEEVDTIMFEGHDTTAACSSFVLCLLGLHSDIQSKVYEEIYEIFGDSDRPATFNDTLQMKYLERVILETLRLYPPVPIIARELKQDVQIVTNNYVLPAGATIVISPYGVHRKYFKDPETFNPDNFLPENMNNRHYYSFIPFSAGPRSCVGRKYALLKLKVLISTILRNYEMISDIPEKDYKLTMDIILKRADGFKLKIKPRVQISPRAN